MFWSFLFCWKKSFQMSSDARRPTISSRSRLVGDPSNVTRWHENRRALPVSLGTFDSDNLYAEWSIKPTGDGSEALISSVLQTGTLFTSVQSIFEPVSSNASDCINSALLHSRTTRWSPSRAAIRFSIKWNISRIMIDRIERRAYTIS